MRYQKLWMDAPSRIFASKKQIEGLANIWCLLLKIIMYKISNKTTVNTHVLDFLIILLPLVWFKSAQQISYTFCCKIKNTFILNLDMSYNALFRFHHADTHILLVISNLFALENWYSNLLSNIYKPLNFYFQF